MTDLDPAWQRSAMQAVRSNKGKSWGGGVLWSPHLIEAPNTVKYCCKRTLARYCRLAGLVWERRERQESGTWPDHIPFFTPRTLRVLLVVKNVAERCKVNGCFVIRYEI